MRTEKPEKIRLLGKEYEIEYPLTWIANRVEKLIGVDFFAEFKNISQNYLLLVNNIDSPETTVNVLKLVLRAEDAEDADFQRLAYALSRKELGDILFKFFFQELTTDARILNAQKILQDIEGTR